MAYNTVTVSNAATQILTPNNRRKGYTIVNNGTATVFLGQDTSVTTANGLPLLPSGTKDESGRRGVWPGAVYGIVASGTVDVRYWEWSE